MRALCVHHESPIEGGIYDRVIPEAGHEIVRWSPFAGEPAPHMFHGIKRLPVRMVGE